MTDNEIIKALEWHLNDESHCSACPYEEHSVTHCCVDMVMKDVLDLIKRQQAEIDDLKRDTIPKLQFSLERANKYGLRLEEENKMFKAEFTRFAEEAAPPYILINTDAELTAEMIETIKKQKPVIVPDNEATVEFLDKASIRTEAVKEFAERLKVLCRQARFSVTVTQDLTGTQRLLDNIAVVDEDDIDNLVKEMVGTEDG